MRGGGLRCSGTYGLLSHCYLILEYIIDIVILNSQDTAQYMYFTQYRVSNKDKVATESEPAHGTKVQGPRWGRGTVRCSVLFIHTRVIHSYQVVVGGSEGGDCGMTTAAAAMAATVVLAAGHDSD